MVEKLSLEMKLVSRAAYLHSANHRMTCPQGALTKQRMKMMKTRPTSALVSPFKWLSAQVTHALCSTTAFERAPSNVGV